MLGFVGGMVVMAVIIATLNDKVYTEEEYLKEFYKCRKCSKTNKGDA